MKSEPPDLVPAKTQVEGDFKTCPRVPTPEPDGGPAAGAGDGHPGHHVVRHVARHAELPRQRRRHLPRAVGPRHANVRALVRQRCEGQSDEILRYYYLRLLDRAFPEAAALVRGFCQRGQVVLVTKQQLSRGRPPNA